MSRPYRLATCLLLAIVASTASAHDLFVTLAKDVSVDTRGNVAVIRNGTFHKSASAFPRDRVRDASLHEGGKRIQQNLGGWEVVGNESRFNMQPATQGTFLLGVSTMASTSTRTAAEFADYLKLEDLPDVLTTYDPSKYPNGVTYSYSKHARAIGQAGTALTNDFAASLGYPLEIQLQRNPAKIKVGERVTFRVLRGDAPAAGLRVYLGSAALTAAKGGHEDDVLVRTDKSGRATFQVTRAGPWYIYTNRMIPSDGEGADFVSDRASLTFDVGGSKPEAGRSR